jgi:hypothetical protein
MIVVVFSGLVAAYELRGDASNVLLAESFDNGTGEWATGEDQFGSLSFRDGGYHMSSTDGTGNFARHFFSESADALSFEARSTSGRGVQFIGLSCWESQSAGYDFLVGGARSFAVQRWTDVNAGDSIMIAERDGRGTPGFFEENHQVRIECIRTESGSARLRLFVDGEQIGSIEDSPGQGPFTGVGLEMASPPSGAEILFDDVKAFRLET